MTSRSQKRIYGLEVELGGQPSEFFEDLTTLSKKIAQYAPATEAMKKYGLPVSSSRLSFNFFLKNESRLYLDGWKVEYATPETASPLDCVTWSLASDRIMEDIANQINREAETEAYRKIGGVTFVKNNIAAGFDTADYAAPLASWGTHQNILVNREACLEAIHQALTLFMASARIWSGSGRMSIAPFSRRFVYELSQRAKFISKAVSHGTQAERGMISFKDEAHSDRSKYLRLHVIGSDSHMSELISYLELSLLGLIVGMVEDGFIKKGDILPHESGQAIDMQRQANSDLTFLKTFALGDDRYTPFDIQMIFLEWFREYEKLAGLTKEEAGAVDKFESLLGKLEKARGKENPEDYLFHECDWAAKLKIMKHDAASHGYSLSEPSVSPVEHKIGNKTVISVAKDRVNYLDIAFHDLRRDRGLHYKLEASGFRERVTMDEAVNFAKYNPPNDTRALLRRRYQDLVDKNNYNILSWDWAELEFETRLSGEHQRRISCLDPFKHK